MADRPLKLAFILAHLRPGGAERAVLNWLTALDRSIIEPLLILRKRDGAFLDQVPSDVTIADLGGRRTALAVPRLAQVLGDLAPDAVYSATSAINLATLGATRLMRSPPKVLVSEHTSPKAYLGEAKGSMLRLRLTRWLYPRAAAILCPTTAIADEIAGVIPGAINAVHLPNPILGDLPPPKPRDKRLIVSAGRLEPVKGMDILIEALADPTLQGARLQIHGEGSERASLDGLVTDLGLRDRVTFSGLVDDLPAAISGAGCFALASRREGFGNVLIEALAVGTPFVASDLPGPRLIAAETGTGRLVPPEDPAALAQAIAAVLAEDSALPVKDGTLDRYSIDRSTEQLTSLVKAACR